MSQGFFDKVYQLVCLIPPGRVATYGQIAALLGYPRAARTVGWALHALPDEQAQVVPWQRVVGAGGRITTSCETHSAPRQRQLLEEEGIEFDLWGNIDMERFQWPGPDWAELDALLRAETRCVKREAIFLRKTQGAVLIDPPEFCAKVAEDKG